MGRLQTEIKQTKPFGSSEEEMYLNLLRTADALMRTTAEMLKPHGLSPTQYNVLRILRGAGNAGLACGEIGGRMVKRDPDITRLLDRLEKRALITRSRESADRRVITTRITPEGQKILHAIDPLVTPMFKRTLGHLGPPKVKQLIELLETAREKVSEE